ncbi:CIC11C00000004124 [Sungouiella intermedia]|uniref:CIC11C00000004124 n=1 Tax=Sungouiella intermedia TaxID=45354 RepID=A0A1L0BNM6_9ASCO|nr:CIC11C00000004124 [[Candida] intermedia]SGZ52969.1 CIC11C00000004793 [[Candida] intermedia]
MPGDKSEMAKNIATSVAGSIGGNKVADALHLGGAGHIAGGVAGSIAAQEGEQKVEDKARQ